MLGQGPGLHARVLGSVWEVFAILARLVERMGSSIKTSTARRFDMIVNYVMVSLVQNIVLVVGVNMRISLVDVGFGVMDVVLVEMII